MLQLGRDRLSLGLLPEAGGAIAWLSSDGVDVLRRGDPAAVALDPTAAACFPLVPYFGQVMGGRFRFADHEHRLAGTHPSEPEPVHGEGWVVPWELVEQGPATAMLRYRHLPGPGTFPFPYLAEQRIALDGDGLAITLAVTCTGQRPMPAGIGVHPYFPDRRGLRLELPVSGMWRRRPLETAADPVGPVPEAWRPALAGPASDLVTDDCFVGWAGKARLEWPGRGIAVELGAEPVFRFVQLYSTAEEDFLCVEPVSNANDGLNLMAGGVEGHGIRVLAPGERLAGTVRIAVRHTG